MNRFDLEQQILECWKVTDDINMVIAYFIDDPKWADMDAELALAFAEIIDELIESHNLNVLDNSDSSCCNDESGCGCH